MAQQLVNDWSAVVHKAFSDAAATGEPLTQQLTTAFGGLAHHLESNTNLRAGMKLSLEPSIDGAHHTYMQWVDATGDVINCAVAAGDISNNGADRRLVWNLCAGFTGAVQVSTILRDDVNLTPPPRIEDTLDAHISTITIRSAAQNQAPIGRDREVQRDLGAQTPDRTSNGSPAPP